MLLIVHADHEQNCSTSTVRMVGSADANLFASISAGICALWGPLHGGANEAVVKMLEQIIADGGDVQKYVEMAKDKSNGFRLMGFGHRVYKNFDPRATDHQVGLRQAAGKARTSRIRCSTSPEPRRSRAERSVLRRAEALSECRLLFGRHLSSDGYSRADVYRPVCHGATARLDRPLGRNAALAHRRISRPRQIYNGPTPREFVPLKQR